MPAGAQHSPYYSDFADDFVKAVSEAIENAALPGPTACHAAQRLDVRPLVASDFATSFHSVEAKLDIEDMYAFIDSLKDVETTWNAVDDLIMK